MFKKILIIYSEKQTKKHISLISEIEEIAGNRKCSSVKVTDIQNSIFNDIDLVITIGGDGTLIRASHFLKNTPIIGINSESEFSEGALTSINEYQIPKLKEILSGKFKKIENQRAEIIRNSVLLDNLALNEIYLGSESQFHTSRYVIRFQEKEEEQRSSGVLIATGSGSTAWYESAGGKPFEDTEKKLRFLVREPYFGRIFNPKILKGEVKQSQSITLVSKMHQGGVIAIDSNCIQNFNSEDKVEISVSENPLIMLFPI
jgi:NAD+ kinase